MSSFPPPVPSQKNTPNPIFGTKFNPPIVKPMHGCLIAALCVTPLLFLLFLGAMIIGIMYPAIHAAHDAASNVEEMNQMAQIACAIHTYADAHEGQLPPAYTVDKNGKPLQSWRVLILPYLNEEELYEQIRLDEPWDSEWNSQFHDKIPAVFSRPEQDFANETVFQVVVGENTLFPPDGKSVNRNDISADFCETLLLAEGRPNHWMDPSNNLQYGNDIEYRAIKPSNHFHQAPEYFCVLLTGDVLRISLDEIRALNVLTCTSTADSETSTAAASPNGSAAESVAGDESAAGDESNADEESEDIESEIDAILNEDI